MPYIPAPLDLEYDAKIPLGHYSSYIRSYKNYYTPNSGKTEEIKIDYEVIGHNSKGSNKIRIISHPPRDKKDTCTALRKEGTIRFTIYDKNLGCNNAVQIQNIYPYHHTKEQQIADEDNFAVEGETILI